MGRLTRINRSIIESPRFEDRETDIVYRIPLTDGEDILFSAERQFFTPRKIASNSPEILNMEYVVEYTATNIPLVKMPIGSRDITDPQYYFNSIVQDIYQPLDIDNFFQELDDDLSFPDDAALDTARQQRQEALNNFLSLGDLAAAATVGDTDAFNEALESIDDDLASDIETRSPPANAVLSPEEFDDLSALELVGLGGSVGTPEGSADIIDPTPTVSADDVITTGESDSTNRLPTNLASMVEGTSIINAALEILNSGVKQVEGAAAGGVGSSEQSEFLTIAPGRFGTYGGGASSQRIVRTSDISNRLDAVKEEIAKQEGTTLPLPGYGKRKDRVGLFSRAKSSIESDAQRPGVRGQLYRSCVAQPISNSSVDLSRIENNETVPMTKDDISLLLQSLEGSLSGILSGGNN